MADIRLTFSKRGRARYISHLDLNRTMQRAFKRAKIPLWYTEGFNPHAYIMFPLALSLGVDSDCEILDFRLDGEMDFDDIKVSLNKALPEGLKINAVALQIKKHTEILKCEYTISITSDVSVSILKESFEGFISGEKIEVEKKTKKKGITKIDIKPMLEISSIEVEGDALNISITLPCGTQMTLNPSLVIDAFTEITQTKLESVLIERTKILCEDGEIFA